MHDVRKKVKNYSPMSTEKQWRHLWHLDACQTDVFFVAAIYTTYLHNDAAAEVLCLLSRYFALYMLSESLW